MNRPDKKNKTLKTVITALIFCGFFVMAGFLAIPEAHAGNERVRSFNADNYPVGETGSHWGDFELHDGMWEENFDAEIVEIDGLNFLPIEMDFEEMVEDPHLLITDPFTITPNDIGKTIHFNSKFIPEAGAQSIRAGGFDFLFDFQGVRGDLYIGAGDGQESFEFEPELERGEIYEIEAEIEIINYYESGDDWIFAFEIYFNIVDHSFDLSFNSNRHLETNAWEMELHARNQWDLDPFYINNLYTGMEPAEPAEPAEPEPFDGFEAITKPADPYSLNEYVLASEVLDFGDYDFEASDNHLAQGVQVVDGDGQIIHEPAKSIIDNFETPADFSTVFEAEPGETYGYRWRYYYVDYITGQTIDSKLTPLENFSHEIDEEAPELETLNAQDVTDTGAELRGRVLSLGDYESLEVSFEWVEAGGENWNETDPVATLDDTFEYPATVWYILDNLEPATTYYFRIKADEYRGSAVSFTTGEEPIDDPEDPVPVDWDDWTSFYDLESDEEFDDPVGVIDGIGTTFNGIMGSIIERIDPFKERLETDQAYSHGREAGEFIPTMRGYLIEFRPFFGGLPVAEVFLFFLIFQIVILGIKGVMIALGFLPFF